MSISAINSGAGNLKSVGAASDGAMASEEFAALLANLQSATSANTDNSSAGISSGITAVKDAMPFSPHTTTTPAQDPVIKKFLDYMNESTAEKFEDQWLAAHHLTRDDLKNMSPEKRTAIMKQMEEDIKRAIEDKVKKDTGVTV